MKKIYQIGALILVAALSFTSCRKGDLYPGKDESALTLDVRITENGQNPDELDLINRSNSGKNYDGYVYTESNDGGTNRILIYKKGADGSLTYQDAVASGGAGNDTLLEARVL